MINRRSAYNELFGGISSDKLSLTNKLIIFLIIISVLITIVATESQVTSNYGSLINNLEISLAIIFSIEYFARLWAVSEDPRYRGAIGRVKYIFTPMALIDLLAFSITLITLASTDGFTLRLIRMILLLRLAKLGKYGKSFKLLKRAIGNQLPELFITFSIAIVVLFVSATLLYLVEGNEQPDNFGSIPRSLYWSVITLTTVGYGDVYPITPVGKFITSILAFVGVALVALPAGILASGLTEAHQQIKEENKGV